MNDIKTNKCLSLMMTSSNSPPSRPGMYTKPSNLRNARTALCKLRNLGQKLRKNRQVSEGPIIQHSLSQRAAGLTWHLSNSGSSLHGNGRPAKGAATIEFAESMLYQKKPAWAMTPEIRRSRRGSGSAPAAGTGLRGAQRSQRRCSATSPMANCQTPEEVCKITRPSLKPRNSGTPKLCAPSRLRRQRCRVAVGLGLPGGCAVGALVYLRARLRDAHLLMCPARR